MRRPIFGFEGFYDIDSTGNIYGLERLDDMGRKVSSRLLKQRINKKKYSLNGYFKITLTKNGKRSHFETHCLVAENFIGPRPKGFVVDHIDGNSLNNNVNNLHYVTSRENTIRGRVSNGIVGVTERLDQINRFVVYKMFNRINYYIGSYFTPELASSAYESATEESAKLMKKNRADNRLSKYNNVNFHRKTGKWMGRVVIDKKLYTTKYFSSDFEAYKNIEKIIESIRKKHERT